MSANSPRLGIVTDESHPDLAEDGTAIAAALEERGVRVDPIVWSDAADLDPYDAVLIRSCWDYHTDPAGFREFVTALERADLAVYNPPAVLRWNAHKSYYRDLEAAGVPIPPSVCLEAGSSDSLAAILREHGWSDAVVKPAVGAGSAGVWKTSLEDAPDDQARFDAACADRDVVVQQFTPEIERGERSIVFVRGEYSHAWNDPTRADDFSDFEDPDLSYEPHDDLRATARSVLEIACDRLGCEPVDLPYARVDYVEGEEGLLVMELELIEPYLGLAREDGALERFVDTVEALVLSGHEGTRGGTGN